VSAIKLITATRIAPLKVELFHDSVISV